MSEKTDLIEALRAARAEGRWPEAPGADLRNAILRNANLGNADLRNANLWGADLVGAILRNAILRNADLVGANLWGANLRNADLRNANLRHADLRNANLGGARWDGLCIDGLPSGQFLLVPTPTGWRVTQGCWGPKTFEDFVAMTASDDWPESTGDEILRRRPIQEGVIALAEAHIADHKKLGTIERLAEKWEDK